MGAEERDDWTAGELRRRMQDLAVDLARANTKLDGMRDLVGNVVDREVEQLRHEMDQRMRSQGTRIGRLEALAWSTAGTVTTAGVAVVTTWLLHR